MSAQDEVGSSPIESPSSRPPDPHGPSADQLLRAKIVAEAAWGRANNRPIHYSQQRPIDGINHRHQLPLNIDCSGFVTLCYKWAGAPDPNGRRYDGYGNTSTLLAHMRHIEKSQVKPGDLCLWEGRHVALVIRTGADPLLISHGAEHGPNAVLFSVANRDQRGRRVFWLTSPLPSRSKAAEGKTQMEQQAPSVHEPPVPGGDPPSEENISPEDMYQGSLDS